MFYNFIFICYVFVLEILLDCENISNIVVKDINSIDRNRKNRFKEQI